MRSINLFFIGVYMAIIIGLSATPSVCSVMYFIQKSELWSLPSRAIGLGLLLGPCYFIYGLTLMLLIVVMERVLLPKLHEGVYSFNSTMHLLWQWHFRSFYIFNATFRWVVDGSRLLPLFYRICGARININTVLSGELLDPLLTIIGPNTLIGRQAMITCHDTVELKFRLRPVCIGANVTIGGRAFILPGAEIGDGAVIGAQALVPANKKIPAGTTWVGIPVREIHKNQVDRKDLKTQGCKELKRNNGTAS